MKVSELIEEMKVCCEANEVPDMPVVVYDAGPVTSVLVGKLAGTGEPCVMLNYYPPSR